MKIRKAIIPAAGLGTRFLPATKAQPKEMLPIVDKPTIQYIVEEAVKSGIEDIIIVTGRSKRSIEDHFDKSIELELELEKKGKKDLLKLAREVSELANIHYIRQKEPKGLGHAILTAKNFIGNEPFAVLLGDDIIVSEKPCIQQMMEVFNEYKTSILGVQKVPNKDVDKYGIIDAKNIEDRIYKVVDMVEKPSKDKAPSNIAILGRYIITPRIFDYLETQEAGAGGEIQLTDALRKLSKEEAMYAYDFIGKRYDVGNKMGFLQATVEFALNREDLREEFLEYLNGLLNENIKK
ncbi:UTP--glucose-1-phosphate uridylyltransferase GalU [Defluviitalea phaphyphila]|uniref:UTP--glucose-1-phosphate uridylyltransferase GalU n=1 Tax=Defluviitalea phaphyphila TaxID=1473580 RepID=UPI00073185D8|nr:UTP--glucose-1-phosphate uridylyltransferase GalU [Defluviitalea phaphyphila]